jgi:hypothetical protein
MDNRSITNNLDETTIEYNDIQKMVFIYNALHDGWTVKKIDNNRFELLKDKGKIKKEIMLDECIKNFINYKIAPK